MFDPPDADAAVVVPTAAEQRIARLAEAIREVDDDGHPRGPAGGRTDGARPRGES